MIKRIERSGEYDFGELIKTQRIERDLSVRELANLSGCSSAAISRWESGKRIPSVESFNKVMAALGVELIVIDK